MSSGETVINSWAELIAHLSKLSGDWAFRGQADARWCLQSKLSRRLRIARIHSRAWGAQEHRILRIFKRKANLFLTDIPDEDDSFRWLALMQHHGAPTRLLDFTWSPYVAAFFALEDANSDAAIWAINPSALSKKITLSIGGKKRKMSPEKVGPWIRGAYEKYFVENKHSFVVYGEPRIMNQRLIAQSGTFVIPSRLDIPVEHILGELYEPGRALKKLVLNTEELRKSAMYELYSMNVTQYTLFPGLDGMARSMNYEMEYNWAIDPVTLDSKPGYDIAPNHHGPDRVARLLSPKIAKQSALRKSRPASAQGPSARARSATRAGRR